MRTAVLATVLGGPLLLAGLAAAGPTTQPAAPASGPASQPVAQPPVVIKPPRPILALPPANANVLAQRRQARDQQIKAATQTKPTTTLAMDDILHFSLKDDRLDVDVLGVLQAFPRQRLPLRITGDPGLWTAFITNGIVHVNPAAPPTAYQVVTLTRMAPSCATDDEPYVTTFSFHDMPPGMPGAIGHTISINETAVSRVISFTQQAASLRLQVVGVAPQPAAATPIVITGSSLTQLVAEHPAECRQYLLPMLNRLGQGGILRPGPVDVYRVYDQLQPTDQARADMQKLIADLDADDAAARESASARLRKLGRDGALAALRLNRDTLTDEQRARLDSFLASLSHRPATQPAAARRDPAFLIDCLEDPDPAVRQLARTDLESLLGHPLAIDLSLRGEKLSAAVDALRTSLRSATTSTTQP